MAVAPTSAGGASGWRGFPWLPAILAFLLGGLAVGLLYHFDLFGGSSRSTVGSGVAASQVRHLPAFDGVELAGSNDVLVRIGGRQSVVVRADDNLLARVTTEVRGRSLVIGNTRGSFTAKSPMSVEVTVPALAALTLAGSGNITVDGVDTQSLTVSLPGSGTLSGSGNARRLEVTVGGSGTVQFTELVARNVRAVVSGSGSIFVTATASLDASVTGTGSILYAGSPRNVTKSVTGTGAIVGS
ncbi:MAG TPA: head GIN domain-containing protein [Gaiellaceae bacterium]|nr:head GIN domain-containing protein [Gaiellaceae bacterium]